MLTAIAVIIIGVKFNLIQIEVLGIISVVFHAISMIFNIIKTVLERD